MGLVLVLGGLLISFVCVLVLRLAVGYCLVCCWFDLAFASYFVVVTY